MPISGACGAIWITSYCLSVFLVRPKFDKIFKNTSTPCDPRIPIFSLFWRTSNYMIYIASNINARRPDPKKNGIYKIYKGYDFRANASLIQIILSYTSIIFVFLTMLAVFLHWAISLFLL